MCLNSKEKECKVAKEAITCYKVVMKVERDEMPALLSTIYDFLYKIGESYEIGENEYFPLKGHPCTNPTVRGVEMTGAKNLYSTTLNHGFHSYKRLKDAKESCTYNCAYAPLPFDWCSFLGEVILKCEIPAGARYWTGNRERWPRDDDRYFEYCSDKIKVLAWKHPYTGKWSKQ